MEKDTQLESLVNKELLRRKVIEIWRSYGLEFYGGKLYVRDLRELQYRLSRKTNLKWIKYKEEVREFFADPQEINILNIEPALVEVKTELQRKIFNYALTFWSIPVSHGYGRRLRFLVIDRQNGKLIGVFGICDPLIGLKVRDEFIGWSKEQKLYRLYNVMTAYVLGAVPPYNKILGGKLVALSTNFKIVRDTFYNKYKNKKTVISKQLKEPYLVMIDTFGAFGKSAIYTRLKGWKFVGYSKGQSHVHITANGSWEYFKKIIPKEVFASYDFGKGSNWKLRILKRGLKLLGFSESALSIGWRRAYYINPLAINWKEFLTNLESIPIYPDITDDDWIRHWFDRWILPRKDSLLEKLRTS